MKVSFGVKGLDVNCTAAIIALASHERYRRKRWVVSKLAEAVSINVRCGENHTWADMLPVTVARRIVSSRIPDLIRTQRSSGGWKIKAAERVTYHVIRSLAYTGLLDKMVGGELKYDPFKMFESSTSIYALEMRRDFLDKQLLSDKRVIAGLRKDAFAMQEANGSWANSVIGCAHHVGHLLALGVDPQDRRLQKCARWIFSMCQEKVCRESSQLGGVLVGHHMFTNPDRIVEFESAAKIAPGKSPCRSCCRHLALAQSSLGVRALIQLGYSEDERVLAACDNLVEIHRDYGGFCDTVIRTQLKKRRALARQTKRKLS